MRSHWNCRTPFGSRHPIYPPRLRELLCILCIIAIAAGSTRAAEDPATSHNDTSVTPPAHVLYQKLIALDGQHWTDTFLPPTLLDKSAPTGRAMENDDAKGTSSNNNDRNGNGIRFIAESDVEPDRSKPNTTGDPSTTASNPAFASENSSAIQIAAEPVIVSASIDTISFEKAADVISSTWADKFLCLEQSETCLLSSSHAPGRLNPVCNCPGCQAFASQVSSQARPDILLAISQAETEALTAPDPDPLVQPPVFRPLRSLGVNIEQKEDETVYGKVYPTDYASAVHGPYDLAPILGAGPARDWAITYSCWTAPSFYHRPLYFEEPDLERYGHYVKDWRCQSLLSTAHFFGSIATLPYQWGSGRQCCPEYTLGYGRPGNCNLQVYDVLPWSPRGLLWHHLTMTGLVFLAL